MDQVPLVLAQNGALLNAILSKVKVQVYNRQDKVFTLFGCDKIHREKKGINH